MLYQLDEAQHRLLGPWRIAAEAARGWYGHPFSALAYSPIARRITATTDLFLRVTARYEKPAWNIDSTTIGGKEVAVEAVTELDKPFCKLVHFRRALETRRSDPRVLLVHINLENRFRLTRGSTARVGYQGVTGLAYVEIEDDGSSAEPLAGKDGAPPRIALRPTVFDTLGEKAGDIVDQISASSLRLSKLLDDRNIQNLTRALENVAAASEGMREMPAILASVREALSENNMRSMRQILAHVEKAAGESAPLTTEMRELVKSMSLLSRRFDTLAGSAGDELTSATLPRANALMRELAANSRQLSRVLDGLESNPQMLIFGRGAAAPGPGEAARRKNAQAPSRRRSMSPASTSSLRWREMRGCDCPRMVTTSLTVSSH